MSSWENLLGTLDTDPVQLLEDMPAWVQISRSDGTIEMVNEAACRISGYGRSEIIGQTSPYPWCPEGWAVESGDPLKELLRSSNPVALEVTCVTRHGRHKVLSVSMSLLTVESGQSQRVLMIALDITERKKWEDSLAQAEKIRVVSQLASGVAHDINNDLAVILGYSEYLLGKPENLDESEQHALAAIQKQAQGCAETVRRIQVFARRVPRDYTYFSIKQAIREVVELAEPAWNSGNRESWTGINLETSLQWVPPVHAHYDSLKEAVTNLVNNAVAALPEGGTVSISTNSSDEDVVLEVSDDGVGINPEDLKRIFDPFFTTKGPASSGLGLSIAFNLVSQSGGVLTVTSQQGVGSTFIARFPPASTEVGLLPEAEDSAPDAMSLRVLVAEDEPLIAGMLKTFLECVGHNVTVCLNGTEAIEAFKNKEFDLAVVDLAMPEVDGWEVSRRVNEFHPEVPIIVVTGWNMSVEDGREVGAAVDSVLRKPFARADLIEAVDQVTGRRRTGLSS